LAERNGITGILDHHDDLRQKLKKLEEPIDRVVVKLNYVEECYKREEREKILKWISDIPFQDHHEEINAMANSGQWLLAHHKLMQWRKSSVSTLLWLRGMGEPLRCLN
jgi:hypothetical protein